MLHAGFTPIAVLLLLVCVLIASVLLTRRAAATISLVARRRQVRSPEATDFAVVLVEHAATLRRVIPENVEVKL